MILKKVFDRFAAKKPICVMMRVLVENMVSAERLDKIFAANAERQVSGELAFSVVANVMSQVVCQIKPTVNAVYVDQKDEIGVTAKSVYDKLAGIEPGVSRALVRDTASRLKTLIRMLGGAPASEVEGYRVKIVDGNHLNRTDRRIGELRNLNAAPLPGKALVVYDPQYRLVVDVFPCEDGHAQERSLLPELLETVEADDLYIADRNFCTISFLFGLAKRRAKFIIRQHRKLPFTLRGRRKRIGETDTGVVYEQPMDVTDQDGNVSRFRRITVVLNKATRDGDREIHLVTNLPRRVSALRIAALYRSRWQIETAFQHVAESLDGEIETLGYPKAALFGFCMALFTFNLWSIIRSAVKAEHGEEAADRLSTYYVALEVSTTHEGMTTVLEGEFWRDKYGSLTLAQLAKELKGLARKIQLSRYSKHKWKPKKPKKPMEKTNRPHVSTARVLAESRKC